MKLLLDTHTFLWLIDGNPRLSSTAADALADVGNQLYFSVASVWELVIKVGNRKLALADPVGAYLKKWTEIYEIDLLPVEPSHVLGIADLPVPHRDPFDRLIISQAIFEEMTLVTADRAFMEYPVRILW